MDSIRVEQKTKDYDLYLMVFGVIAEANKPVMFC